MHKLRLLSAIACFSCVFLYGAPDPRIYLQHDWYVVEVVVFERIDSPPSPEHLIHGSDYRTFSADLRAISSSEQQQRKLEEIVQAHSSTPSDLPFDSSTNAHEQSSESTTPIEGCWLHQRTMSTVNLNKSISNEQEDLIEPADISDEHNLFDKQAVFNDDPTPPSRDPLLPDWLPDDWETEDVVMHRVGRILGLCEEDMGSMLALQALTRTQPEEDEDVAPVTAQLIEQEFATYERDLHRSTGIRRDRETWTLARAASRLSNEGYRIIDHASWHQDALERGANKPLLVQFGHSRSGDRFEVEGTVVLSSARFLHLDVDLWKSIESETSTTGTDQLPRLLYYSMQESRRMTLGVTHYFDHPKFGLLVRVQRLPVPERLESLLEQLDNAF